MMLHPIKSRNNLIMWSCKITWQTKPLYFHYRRPMITKPGKMVTYLEGLLFIQLAIPFGPHDRLIPLYLHHHNAHSYQTWQGGDLLWGALTIKSCDPLITWPCEITWQTIPMISPLRQCLLITNLVGLWITLRGSHSYNHMNLITWSTEFTWQFEYSIFPLSLYGSLNLAGCWLRGDSLACKCLTH